MGLMARLSSKTMKDRATGKRLYLQLKFGDSYLKKRKAMAQTSFKSKTLTGPIIGSYRLIP